MGIDRAERNRRIGEMMAVATRLERWLRFDQPPCLRGHDPDMWVMTSKGEWRKVWEVATGDYGFRARYPMKWMIDGFGTTEAMRDVERAQLFANTVRHHFRAMLKGVKNVD